MPGDSRATWTEPSPDYNSSIDLDPKSDLTYVNRGNVKSTKGDVDGAIADYNRAIELNPNFARSYYCRGNDREPKGDQDGALADYTRAIELRPKYNDACDAIAWLLATSWQPSVRNGAKSGRLRHESLRNDRLEGHERHRHPGRRLCGKRGLRQCREMGNQVSRRGEVAR